MFTADGFYRNNLKNGLRYSIVDMCLDDELGDIMPDQKNMLMAEFMTEKIAVARHANGIDYWILTHKYQSTDFYAYRLTPNGLEENPVVTGIGSIHQDFISANSTSAAIGQMKISPNGKKLALCFTNTSPNVFEMFDFDAQTGKVSNVISFARFLTDNTFSTYGIEFSPGNSKLYLATSSGIAQVNLNAGNGTNNDILNSFVFIHQGYSCLLYTSPSPRDS